MLLDLKKLVKRYNINPTGVFHAGAHTGEERGFYKEMGWNVLWFEPNKDLAMSLRDKGQDCIAVALSDKDGKADYHQMTLSSSNSLLELNQNKTWRNDLNYVSTVKVPTMKLSNWQDEYDYNFLVMDTQGSELKILMGTDLSSIDYVYTEVHLVETYKNCPRLHEIDSFLHEFKRVAQRIIKKRWGDALYIRGN